MEFGDDVITIPINGAQDLHENLQHWFQQTMLHSWVIKQNELNCLAGM